MSSCIEELAKTDRGGSPQRRAPDRNPPVIACPTCSTLDPPYGNGIMAITDADGWRHARICATCHGWGRVHRTPDGCAYEPAPFRSPQGHPWTAGPEADDDAQEVW